MHNSCKQHVSVQLLASGKLVSGMLVCSVCACMPAVCGMQVCMVCMHVAYMHAWGVDGASVLLVAKLSNHMEYRISLIAFCTI
jgi:hypothetical protein